MPPSSPPCPSSGAKRPQSTDYAPSHKSSQCHGTGPFRSTTWKPVPSASGSRKKQTATYDCPLRMSIIRSGRVCSKTSPPGNTNQWATSTWSTGCRPTPSISSGVGISTMWLATSGSTPSLPFTPSKDSRSTQYTKTSPLLLSTKDTTSSRVVPSSALEMKPSIIHDMPSAGTSINSQASATSLKCLRSKSTCIRKKLSVTTTWK